MRSLAHLQKKKTSILKGIVLRNMESGIWESIQTKKKIPKGDKFPYSDFSKVNRCGVIAAETRAGQYKYNDIEQAAASMHEMIDAARKDV
jgi:hypothetical protein